MADRYKFTIVNGSVTEVYELEDGIWKLESIDPYESYVVDGASVLKIEKKEEGRQEIDRFVDPDGDGIYDKSEARIYQGDDEFDAGSRGPDQRRGSTGNDEFFGREDNDSLFGEEGNDRLCGDDGDDDLDGGDGDDDLDGGRGRDRLKGARGRDVLRGGDDVDAITGGRDGDTCSGGGAGDRFIYTNLKDSARGKSKRDSITDFNATEGDLIDLEKIDANRVRSGNQAFRFIRTKRFSGRPGELRLGREVLQADCNGDRKADFEIGLPGVDQISKSQFLL